MNYAESWAIRKDDKTPYVEQLVHNIRWSIFTGEIRFTEKLPPIRTLAKELSLGVNTVRNAYKKLEEQSLVVTKPHIGTVVQMETADFQVIRTEIVATIKKAMYSGMTSETIREIVETTLEEAEREHRKKIIFVYEDPEQGHRYAEQLAREVDVQVQEVALQDIRETVKNYDHIETLDAIVTTYFSYSDVLRECPDLRGIICGMTVEISREVIHALDMLEDGDRITLLCKKTESAQGFQNLIRRDYPELAVDVYHETKIAEWKSLTRNSSAVFVSPSLMPDVAKRDLKPAVYEIWDRLNSQSVQMLRAHLNQGNT